MDSNSHIYGLLAEYETPHGVLTATRHAHLSGYRKMDAYTPYPVEGLAECLGASPTRIPFIVLVGAIVGAASGFLLQYYTMTIDYPYNAGGRPLNSWPAFFPITFETSILLGSLGALIGMLFLNGLPRPHHPLLGIERFERASQDRFFLCIEATDPKFHNQRTLELLLGTEPVGAVIEVLHEPEGDDALEREIPEPALVNGGG